MMTLIGKALVFITLVLGVGVAVFSISVYTQRPGWFEQAPEGGVDEGNSPISFPQLTKEITALGAAATSASVTWGEQLRDLRAAEKTRDERRNKMYGPGGYLDWAQKGSPPAQPGGLPGPGFFELTTDETTKLIDLDKPGTAIQGPDGRPLAGAGTLLDRYNTDSAALSDLTRDLTRLRADQKRLQGEILIAETRVLKQRDIREQLRNEASYLADLEVNVAEQRSTVTRRREQLKDRLDVFKK